MAFVSVFLQPASVFSLSGKKLKIEGLVKTHFSRFLKHQRNELRGTVRPHRGFCNADKIVLCFFSVVLAFLFLLPQLHADDASPPQTTGYFIQKIESKTKQTELLLTVRGNKTRPTFTTYELFDPLRLVVDIADAGFGEEISLPMTFASGPISAIHGKLLTAKKPAIVRLEFHLRDDHAYAVDLIDNDIAIALKNERHAPAPEKAVAFRTVTGNASLGHDTTQDDNIAVTPESLEAATGPTLVAVTTESGESGEGRVSLRFIGGVVAYSRNELPADGANQPRMYLDFPEARLDAGVQNTYQGIGPIRQIRVSRRTAGVRVVFDSAAADIFDAEVSKGSDSLTVVARTPVGAMAKKNVQEKDVAGPDPVKGDEKNIPAEASAEKTALFAGTTEGGTGVEESDQFSKAGYKEKRISVDFFKIDLHNVFRLFGEISGRNMVVEESIKGSLTLSLRNVPWDFALDVILNLKDLQKEERFNTIVILPKKKEFYWPEKPKQALAIEEDKKTLTIIQKIESPKNLVEAKKLIRQGLAFEKQEALPSAVTAYTKAFEMWPQNTRIGLRLASLSLVQEKNNARAVYFAKQVLKYSPENSKAAMLAAIGLANMKRPEDAERYFGLAVSDKKPPAAVYLNYAAFLENRGRTGAALNQLAAHDGMYGENLESMAARARLLDKQDKGAQAVGVYRSILLSGFQVPDDLHRYIRGRIALEETKSDTSQGAGR